MKRPTPRPAAALVLTATAIFVLLGNRCGLLGQLLTACLARLLGVPGMALLVLTLLALAVAVGAPGLLTRLAQRLVNARPRSVNAKAAPVNKEEVPARGLHERRRLDMVRGALKELGYAKTEYEPLVEKMDPSLTPDVLLRAAIQALTVN